MNHSTGKILALRNFFPSFREKLSGREDSEHVQALVRIAIASIILLYLFFINASGNLTAEQHRALIVVLCFDLAALGLFMLIVYKPNKSPTRRLVAMVFDFGTASYMMYLLGDKALPFFAVYLWVTIGNGLRYGVHYLYAAMAISIICFTVVFVISPYWRQQWGFSTGLLIGLVALPLYFSILLKKLRQQHDELKRLYKKMAKHATHDFLTGLPNRKHFYDQLAEAIVYAKQETKNFAVLYVDLDGFKSVNDDLGHAVGDQLIERTARRLEKCTQEADMVARVGGDEFVVILKDIAQLEVSKVAEKIIKALAEPFMIVGKSLSITTSIGVATYPQDGEDVNTLIHNADSAMYEAKRNGKNGYRICRSKHMFPYQLLTAEQTGLP